MYHIKDTCVGCHYCELECPSGAIDYEGTQYQIDPEKCICCGLCQSLCPTCSIYSDEEERVAPHPPITLRCDVLVAGGGCGLITAVKAAQSGKKVILIEKSAHLGGNTDLAHGFFPVYTKMHEEIGAADMRDEGVEELWKRSGGFLDKEVVRTAVYGCGEFFDWLCRFPGTAGVFNIHKLGEMREQGPIFGSAVVGFPKRQLENLKSRDPSIGPGWAGTWIKHKMLEAIERQGLDVTILTEHAAESLITDESGAVTGVVAKDPGGVTEIYAKAVVLATGGFGRSDEKLQKYCGFFDVDRPVTRFSVPTDTGDGIDMLRQLGVEPDPERMFISLFGPAHHPFSYCLYRIHAHPTSLWVNLDGKRWQDEVSNFFLGRFNIAGNPKEVSWGIFSQKTLDDAANEYLNDPALSAEREFYVTYMDDIRREAALKWAPVRIGETVEELAEKLEIDPAALRQTFEEYEGFCAEGLDRQFGKDSEFLKPLGGGPYYAIYGQRFCEGAFGGIRVDAECRCLREDGAVISGLYGVGDATSAMHKRGELAPISELTWAVASAYVSAQNAVKYIDAAMA